MVTPGMPGPLTGPPTWGMYPVTMGQTCMLPMVATGFPAIAVWFIALDYYCLLHYIYFKGGTFYAGHGATHIGLHAAFHRSEEHTSELQSRPHLVCRLLLEKKNKKIIN